MPTALQRLTSHVGALFPDLAITNDLLLDYARAVASRHGMFDRLEAITSGEDKATLVLYFLQLDAVRYVQERERAALTAKVDAIVQAKYPTPVPPKSIS